jgi:hypothetical protein
MQAYPSNRIMISYHHVTSAFSSRFHLLECLLARAFAVSG